MITQQDLQAAIAECQGERHPSASTCIKLAAFYTIRDHLFPGAEEPRGAALPAYSFAAPLEPSETIIDYQSDTEFSQAIDGRKASEVWPIIDELVTTVQVLNPRLYASFMDKLSRR